MAHALLSPSSAEKWVACPASRLAEEAFGTDHTTVYAAEGTAAHFLASEYLTTGAFDFESITGTHIYINVDGAAQWEEPERYLYKIPVDPAMAAHIKGYVDDLTGTWVPEAPGGVLHVEVGLDLTPITGEQGAIGTADAVVVSADSIQVHDLKYGMKPVKAYKNKQLLIYAAAAVEYFGLYHDFSDSTTVDLVIHQPRVPGGGETTRSYTLTVGELREELAPIKTAAGLAMALSQATSEGFDIYKHAVPGEHCSNNYCNVRTQCPALREYVEGFCEGAKAFAGAPDAPNTDELGALAAKVPVVQGWCKAVTDELNRKVLNGEEVPGFKVVKGREGNREWVDEKTVLVLSEQLGLKRDVVCAEVLRSPTQLDVLRKAGKIKKSDWPLFEEMIRREPAGNTVVPVSDSRPAVDVKASLTDGFESL